MENCMIYIGGFCGCDEFLGICKGLSPLEKRVSFLARIFLEKLCNPYFVVQGKDTPTTRFKERVLNFKELYAFEKEEILFYEEDFWDEFKDVDELFEANVEKHTEVIHHKASEYKAPLMYMNLQEIEENKKVYAEIFSILERKFDRNNVFTLSFTYEEFVSVPNGEYSVLKQDATIPHYEDFFKSENRLVTNRVILKLYCNDDLEASFYLNDDGSIAPIPAKILDLYSICDELYSEIDVLYRKIRDLDIAEQKTTKVEHYAPLNSIAFKYWDILKTVEFSEPLVSIA